MTIATAGDSSEICFEHELYRKDVEKGGSTELRLWWLPGAAFKMTCFVWCSALPIDEDDSANLDEETADSLVR